MTRRGSLVYYLASWICGGFFMTVAMFLQEQFAPQGMGIGPSGAGAVILTTYFLILIFRAFFSVVFAFLLRLSMDWLHAKTLGMGSGRDDSLTADGPGSVLGVSRGGCGGAAGRVAPGGRRTLSRLAPERGKPHKSERRRRGER